MVDAGLAIRIISSRRHHDPNPRSGPVIPSDLPARPAPATGPVRKLPGLLMCVRLSPPSMGQRVPREDDGHGDADRSAPEPGPPGDAADAGRLHGMPDPGFRVGAPAPVPDPRACGLLRLFAAPARPGPRLRGRAPDRPVVRAGRGIGPGGGWTAPHPRFTRAGAPRSESLDQRAPRGAAADCRPARPRRPPGAEADTVCAPAGRALRSGLPASSSVLSRSRWLISSPSRPPRPAWHAGGRSAPGTSLKPILPSCAAAGDAPVIWLPASS